MTAGSTGQCPHCTVTVQFVRAEYPGDAVIAMSTPPARITLKDGAGELELDLAACPQCRRLVVTVTPLKTERGMTTTRGPAVILWPRTRTPAAIPSNIPDAIRRDYLEAYACRDISTRASAALSRRCLQAILRAHGHKAATLRDEIDLALPTLPAYLQTDIDDMRRVGNIAAHEKLDQSGSVLDVTPEEADWLLHLLGLLFDHYYVLPAVAAQRRAALNAKDPNTQAKSPKTKP